MRRNCFLPTCSRALAAALAAATLSSGCGQQAPTVENAKSSSATDEALDVLEVRPRPWPRIVRVQGTLMEDESAQLGTKVAGRVKEVLVDLGSRVEQGQPIARLDTEEFDLRVRQAQAQVAQARATLGLKGNTPDDQIDPHKASPVLQELALLEDARLNVQRAHRLTERAVFTQEEVQARESTFHVAEARHVTALNAVYEQIAILSLRRAELALAVQNQKDAVIKAPFVGIVSERHVAPGSYVSVGQTLATLVRIDPLRFRAGVPERAATGVSIGQPVRIFLEGQSDPIEIKISRISPSLDVTSRSLTIEADVDNSPGRLRSGLFAEAEILVDPSQHALAVPVRSLVTFGGVERVWAVKDNQSSPRPLRTGRRDGDFVEVLDGLKDGDLILSDGARGHEGVVRIERAATRQEPDRAALLGQ
jgi:RND family efflux transporter MFP subunit